MNRFRLIALGDARHLTQAGIDGNKDEAVSPLRYQQG